MYRVYVHEQISSRPFRYTAQFADRQDAAEFIAHASDELPRASFSLRPVSYRTPRQHVGALLERRDMFVRGVLACGVDESQYRKLVEEVRSFHQESNEEVE